MPIDRIQKAISNFSDKHHEDPYSGPFLSDAIALIQSLFGFEQGEGILVDLDISRAYFSFSKGRGEQLEGSIKNFTIKETFFEAGIPKQPVYLKEIESFETLSGAHNLCRKFVTHPAHLELLMVNFSKAPSVLFPIHNSKNMLIGFIHGFNYDLNKERIGSELDGPISLVLIKKIIEDSVKSSILSAQLAREQNLSNHLNLSIQKLEQEILSIKRNQSKLIMESRKSGMSDVATGVLHNVGNVLNSINVSSSLISKDLSRLKVEALGKVASLLSENKSDLNTFITNDPIGKSLLGLIGKIADDFTDKKNRMEEEIITLCKHIEHVNSVINTQQTHAKEIRSLESCSLISVIEDAILMGMPRNFENDIQITQDFEPVPNIWINRHKVLQIIVNLISNARNSLMDCGRSQKLLKVSLARTGKDRVRISVVDNGVGIPLQNIQAVFTQGFSTRKNGHGFGLHTSLNDAQELNAKLWCESNGTGQGAAFYLDLPIQIGEPHDRLEQNER